MKNLKSFLLTGIFTLLIYSAALAQQTGGISGTVYDSLGAVVVGAQVIAVDAGAKEKTAVTNGQGAFTITGLAPGKYTLRVVAPKFALYENTEVEVKAGEREEMTIALAVEEVQAEVDVNASGQISTDSENNASATVLKEKDLEALPDDPEELEAALQALAGPSAGPNGGQIYIDGFTGGRIPPKDAIREIRINQNPFSAEYDRLGFGRIEILTKPGSDKWRGQAFMNFNDESLNSRNPFAANRAASQTRFYGGNISGPIRKNKSSFFLDVSNREVDNNTIVNALVLDPALNFVPFRQDFTVPTRRFSISPRFDYQLNDTNTLVARYSFNRTTTDNQGISEFSLPSRAFSSSNTEHTVQLTETMVVNAKTINETRFQYSFNNREQTGDNTIPTVNVSSAFIGGGAQVGLNYTRQNSWELQNYTTTSIGKNLAHAIKFGVRVRGVNLEDRSEANFGGTFVFSGVRDPQTGEILFTSIEQFRQKVLGNPDPRFNPNQFSITAGNPIANVSRVDVGGFITDDWKARQDLTLSFGLRYENQTNIGDSLNFAPRFGFAWAPGAGGAKQPKTVFRGGFGVFYDRFSENYTLQARRFDGTQQMQFIVPAGSAILSQPVFTADGSVTNVPTAAQLSQFAPLTSTIRTVATDLQAPYTLQGAVGVERQLPYKTTMAIFFIASRNLHLLRQRNVNAFIAPDFTTRPDPTRGNIYQYESSGVLNQQQLIFNFNANINPNLTIAGNYRLGFAKSDTDSLGGFAGGFPAYSYDLSGEYGKSTLDVRHSFFFRASIGLPWKIRLNPLVIASSGRPFNIVTGFDTNRDSIFAERPTFEQLNARCAELNLTSSWCDIGANDPNAVIPRNYGRGPSSINVNLNLSKTFGFGGSSSRVAENQQPTTTQPVTPALGGGGNRRGGNRGGGNRGGGNRGGGFGGGSDKPYNLTFQMSVSNLFNRNNANTPVGSLNSPFFGRPVSTAGFFGFFGGGGGSANRRIEFSARFNW